MPDFVAALSGRQVWVVVTLPADPWAADQLAGSIEVLGDPPLSLGEREICYTGTVNGGFTARWYPPPE
jgi:hypothetical protein